MEKKYMTDLKLLDKYCESCLVHVHPMLLNDVVARGLYWAINYLPNDVQEAKAVVRARLAAAGKYVEDEEIQEVQQWVNRMNFLQKELAGLNMADVHKTLPVLEEITDLSKRLQNYYK